MKAYALNQLDLNALVASFYSSPDDLGQFRPLTVDQVPDPYRKLLAHEHHMTVTVESFHGSPVDVDVLEVAQEESLYRRRILLRRQSDGEVVQFGIVHLSLDALSQTVRRQIESADVPLGRVLIQNEVMRDVELGQVYEIRCGKSLAELFAVSEGTTTYGRTAVIHCDGEPAVRLLEIVTPVGDTKRD